MNFTNAENLLKNRNSQIPSYELLLFNFRHTMMPTARVAVTFKIIERLHKIQQQSGVNFSTKPSDSDQYGVEMITKKK